VEEIDKGEDIPTVREKGGGMEIVVILKNSTGDGVRGRGAGDSRKDAAEKPEASVATLNVEA